MDYEFKAEEQIKCPICGESANYREFPDVVRLIEQGEAFEAMWEELQSYFMEEKRQIATKWILGKMDKIKQKYFPKNEETDEKG